MSPVPLPVPRSVARVGVAGAAVFLAGALAAVAVEGAPPVAAPVRAAPAAAPAPVAPAVVPLAVAPPAPVERPFDAGDPTTWSNGQLAAQVVFTCVHASQLGRAEEQARAGTGGIVVMGRPSDGAQLAAALAVVRAAGPHGVAPLIASDEEGGLVQRLRDVLGTLPSAAEMGGWPDERIEATAFDYGSRMRALGYAMALSPVADLAVPGSFIADQQRAFSADPARAASAAAAWARGMGRAGVAPAAKHWPGHGSGGDSHDTAPVVPPLAALEGRDLLPFSAVLDTGAGVVMVGHLRSEGLTDPGLPATLSPTALRVLRERAGADTVLLTDSLSMAAGSSAVGLTPADAAVRSLQAGADWAMVCVDAPAAVDAVRAALDTGAWPRDAAVTSVRRVLALKQRLGLTAVPLVSRPPVGALEGAERHGDVLRLVGSLVDPEGAARVLVVVDGVAVGETVAAGGRFDVAAPVVAGVPVCLEGVGTGPGPTVPLGCTTP